MMTAMTSLENMIDVNTIVGDMVTTPDGTVIIPVSKVCFGFAAGGSEFNTNKLNKFAESSKLPFGGGSGAGVNIMPMAFLVVKDSTIRLLDISGGTTIDKVIDLVPELITKVGKYFDKKTQKPTSSMNTSEYSSPYKDDYNDDYDKENSDLENDSEDYEDDNDDEQ